tara:strand:- start:1285 stop:4482 length:3198 start_codon:yes stop_codon:yes gene_type:complete
MEIKKKLKSKIDFDINEVKPQKKMLEYEYMNYDVMYYQNYEWDNLEGVQDWCSHLRECFFKHPCKLDVEQSKSPHELSKHHKPEGKVNGHRYGAFQGLKFKRPYTNTWKTMSDHTAYIICCGEKNQLSVIDLDISKPYKFPSVTTSWEEQGNGHPFIHYFINEKKVVEKCENWRDTLQNIINYLGTFTVQTPSGGFHLYFHNKHCDTTPHSGQISKIDVDLQCEGQMIVGACSEVYVQKEEGKFDHQKIYECIKNVKPVDFEIVRDLWEYLYSYKGDKKQKAVNKKMSLKRIEQQRPVDVKVWNFRVTDSELKYIEDRLPDTMFESFENYLKITSFYKAFDRKKEWDEISKKYPNYNAKNNENIWHSAWGNEQAYPVIEWVLSRCLGNLTWLLPNIKYKPIRENKIQPDKMINSNRISQVIDIEDNKNYVIQSPMATGKSYLINALHNDDKSKKIISIVSRISLAKEHFRCFHKYNADKELDDNEYILYCLEKGSLQNFEGENIIICIDSLERLRFDDYSEYILIFDEWNSIFEYLWTSSTLKNKRRKIKNILKHMLNECKQFICLDADISDKCLEYLNEPDDQSPQQPFEFIKNTFLPFTGTEAEELFDYEILAKKLAHLKKFMVCTDSRTEALKLKKKIEKICGISRDDIVVITKDHTSEVDLDKYECVIFSPKIIYGLDSQMKRQVFTLFTGNTITAKAMCQQVARCRNIEKLWYYFPNQIKDLKNGFDFNCEEEVLRRITLLEQWSTEKYVQYSDLIEEAIENDDETLGQDCFTNELAQMENNYHCKKLKQIIYDEDCDRANKKYHFVDSLRQKGFNVIETTGLVKARDKEEQKELKEQVKDQIKEDFIQNIDNEIYQRTNQIFNMNKEQMIEHSELFTEPNKFQEHIAFSYLFFEKQKHLRKKFKEEFQSDYGVNVELDTASKCLFIQNLMDDVQIEENSLFGQKKLNEKQAETYAKQYQILFNSKRKIDFQNSYDVGKILNCCIKKMCGSSPYDGTDIKLPKNPQTGKRQSVMTYHLNVESNDYKYHKNVYNIRDEPRKKRKALREALQNECLIDDPLD